MVVSGPPRLSEQVYILICPFENALVYRAGQIRLCQVANIDSALRALAEPYVASSSIRLRISRDRALSDPVASIAWNLTYELPFA